MNKLDELMKDYKAAMSSIPKDPTASHGSVVLAGYSMATDELELCKGGTLLRFSREHALRIHSFLTELFSEPTEHTVTIPPPPTPMRLHELVPITVSGHTGKITVDKLSPAHIVGVMRDGMARKALINRKVGDSLTHVVIGGCVFEHLVFHGIDNTGRVTFGVPRD